MKIDLAKGQSVVRGHQFLVFLSISLEIYFFGTVVVLSFMYYLIFLLVIYFGWLVVKASLK